MAECAVAAEPVADRVRFLGYRSDLADVLRQAAVVAVPSRHEGLMRGMIEAMSCGRPVVSFDVCSAREVLENKSSGAGAVVPLGDYLGMATSLLHFATDMEAQIAAGQAGSEAARELFDPDRVVERYERVYQELGSDHFGMSDKRELSTGAVYRRLARNSAYLAGGTVASALFMMLAVVLSARALSARDFGLLVLFQSATMLFASFMSFSTQQPVIKLGFSAQAEGDQERLGRIVALGLLFDGLAAVAATVAAFAFVLFGRGWIELDDRTLGVATLFAVTLLFTGYLTSNGIFRLLNRFGLLSLIQAGCAAGILTASAYLYASGAPFEYYCWAWAIFYVLNGQIPLVVALYLARRAGIPIDFCDGQDGAWRDFDVFRLLLDDLGYGHRRSAPVKMGIRCWSARPCRSRPPASTTSPSSSRACFASSTRFMPRPLFPRFRRCPRTARRKARRG